MENIGDRLKSVRKSKKMTLKQISEKTNLSISFLSQVEHAKCSVTLESLMKISEALEVSPSFFFSDQKGQEIKSKIAVHKQQSLEEDMAVSNFTYKDLSGNFPNQTFLPTLVTLQPRNEGGRALAHNGQEFIFVLEGTLTVIFEDGELALQAGESLHMESTTPHNWLNKTNEAIKFLYVSSR
ncbi:helix-turn-helix domain-containing protein [Bacillus horti]|uniref:Transcriptional regulator with XRE-family HTH domain n=1 Tax=Caldalkalibacillus horti TaxID=77523 RepID=A0ABT9W406_9BACI|nr:XRE family transcriptional regulator [Bacillus horti]MDQ0167969.1 transcriptional regulator with XRE-family HTH domain [Bacillus horti]